MIFIDTRSNFQATGGTPGEATADTPDRSDLDKARDLILKTKYAGFEHGLFDIIVGMMLLVHAIHRYLTATDQQGLDNVFMVIYVAILVPLVWLMITIRNRQIKERGTMREKFGPVIKKLVFFVSAAIVGLVFYMPETNFLGTGLSDPQIGFHGSAILWLIACLLMLHPRFLLYGIWSVIAYLAALTVSPGYDFGGVTQNFQIYGILTALLPVVLGLIITVKYFAENLRFGTGTE